MLTGISYKCFVELTRGYEKLIRKINNKPLIYSISFDSREFEIICSYYYTDPYKFDFYNMI